MGYKDLGKFSVKQCEMASNMILSGFTEADISAMLGVTPNSFRDNLKGNLEMRRAIKLAKKAANDKGVHNLRKLADGFNAVIKKYIMSPDSFDADKLEKDKQKLIQQLQSSKYKEFFDTVVGAFIGKPIGNISVEQKYYPPDRESNKILLAVANPETWDLELKKKQTPQTVIHVKIDKTDPLLIKQTKKKEIEADFVIQN